MNRLQYRATFLFMYYILKKIIQWNNSISNKIGLKNIEEQ